MIHHKIYNFLKKMYSRQYLFSISIIAFFIFSAQTAYSQSINLEQLGSLTKAIGGEMSSDVSDVDVSEQKQTTTLTEDSPEDQEKIEYGYTGRKDSFIAKPRPKIKQEVTHFGYDFFAEAPSTFASTKKFFVPDNYIIGPGDVIKIVLFGNRNNRYELEVSNEGEILVPGIGPVSASGLSFEAF